MAGWIGINSNFDIFTLTLILPNSSNSPACRSPPSDWINARGTKGTKRKAQCRSALPLAIAIVCAWDRTVLKHLPLGVELGHACEALLQKLQITTHLLTRFARACGGAFCSGGYQGFS